MTLPEPHHGKPHGDMWCPRRESGTSIDIASTCSVDELLCDHEVKLGWKVVTATNLMTMCHEGTCPKCSSSLEHLLIANQVGEMCACPAGLEQMLEWAWPAVMADICEDASSPLCGKIDNVVCTITHCDEEIAWLRVDLNCAHTKCKDETACSRVVKVQFSLVLHPKFVNAKWNHWFSLAVFLNLELNVMFGSKAFGSHLKRVWTRTERLLSHQNLIFSNAISKAIIVISTSQISKSNGQYPHATDNALCKCMQNLQYHAFIGCVEGKRCVGDGRNPHFGLLAFA